MLSTENIQNIKVHKKYELKTRLWGDMSVSKILLYVLAATTNLTSSGQKRACSTSTMENESMALMQCPSVLSAPTLMCHFYTLNTILQPPHTMRRSDVVLAATPNLASWGQRWACSTATIKDHCIALMQCPFALYAPTLMCLFYSINAILQALHTVSR